MSKALTVYWNGSYQQFTEAELKPWTPGFVKGFGVFETILLREGHAHFLKEHYQRFRYGCDRYILPAPPPVAKIQEIIAHLCHENRLSNARVRLSAWRKGYDVHLGIVAIPREDFPESVYSSGFAACIYPKVLDRSPELARIKSLDYGFFLRAYEFALENRFQEAILLNSGGCVVEGSRSNVFLVIKGKLYTPGVPSGCLAGVTRGEVIRAARREKVRLVSGDVRVKDLQRCEEAFVTNALVGIMPLTRLGDHSIGRGQPGVVTKRLMKAFKKISQESGTYLL